MLQQPRRRPVEPRGESLCSCAVDRESQCFSHARWLSHGCATDSCADGLGSALLSGSFSNSATPAQSRLIDQPCEMLGYPCQQRFPRTPAFKYFGLLPWLENRLTAKELLIDLRYCPLDLARNEAKNRMKVLAFSQESSALLDGRPAPAERSVENPTCVRMAKPCEEPQLQGLQLEGLATQDGIPAARVLI